MNLEFPRAAAWAGRPPSLGSGLEAGARQGHMALYPARATLAQSNVARRTPNHCAEEAGGR